MNRKLYQSALSFACCAALLGVMTTQPRAMSTSAASAILVEADSGRVLYEHNADQEMLIASTTKIMTALVALESCPLSDTVKVTQAHMAEGSSMYLRPGEELSLETLLYGLLLCSGNDAALAVADHCGPGVDAFVAKMNQKAREIGMEHTSFANPNGLDDERHYSTARDMARLAACAMRNETFARIVSTRSITIDGRTMVNHNRLLSACSGCIGVKTGYTRAAGRTLVSCAVRNDLTLIAVTLKDGNDWADHTALYDMGFAAYRLENCAANGQQAMQLPVLNGRQASVPVLYAADFSYPLRDGEQIETAWETSGGVFAPVCEGQSAGEAVFSLNGQELGRVPLLYGATVDALEKRAPAGALQRWIAPLRTTWQR